MAWSELGRMDERTNAALTCGLKVGRVGLEPTTQGL